MRKKRENPRRFKESNQHNNNPFAVAYVFKIGQITHLLFNETNGKKKVVGYMYLTASGDIRRLTSSASL